LGLFSGETLAALCALQISDPGHRGGV